MNQCLQGRLNVSLSNKSWKRQWVDVFLVAASATLVTACGSTKIAQQEDDLMKKQAELETKLFEQGKVLYARTDIDAGSIVQPDWLEERSVQISRIPLDALPSRGDAIQHRAKFDIPAGQVVSKFDLVD
jgi:hypothetical protein